MFLLVVDIFAAYIILRSIYRLYFHPLSGFPGPKLAALTSAYEFYYDVVQHGMYIWEIEKMHQKYGPVVRINPRELHIKDPHFYDEIYAPSSRGREKDPKFVVVFGFSTSVIATVGHDHHRLRRTLLNNFFSKKSVVDLAPMMHEKESKLMRRIESAHQHDAVVHIDDAFAALTADLISEYSWGVSTGFLDDDDFKNDIRQALNEISELVHYNRFFPILGTIMRELPRFLLARIRPGAKAVLDMQDVVTKQADRTVSKAGTESPTQTIFDALRDPSVPLAERSSRRLEDEGLIMVVAGTETTARTLTVATFHLYQDNNPFLQKLREELRTVMPMPTSQVSWPQLEQLPYLNGVVMEAIRLSYGPIFRSTRVAPTEAIKYQDLVIPPGSPVSMSSYFVHMDPEIFPNPTSFEPERWIRAREQGFNLQKFIVSFTRGSRICLGMNLAYAELYMTLAAIVRRFDFELFETTSKNIKIHRELGIGQPKNGEFTVKVKVTKVLQD